MKAPRVTDFDPNAKPIELGSPMDNFPTLQRSNHQEQPQAKTLQPERPNERTLQRPNGKRIITRNSFEIYEDQMDSLRRLSFEEKMQGKIGSMSAMVRDAIDSYIKKRPSEK